MNAEPSLSPEQCALPTGTSRRRADAIDEPARPLGAKCAALQCRRRRATAASRPGSSRRIDSEALCFSSATRQVRFVLHTSAGGLLVERSQSGDVGLRLTQYMVFADSATFDHWCENEPLRFDEPLLHGQLLRHGHDLLESSSSSR